MSSTPLISVVIPAYNASRWIAETIFSVIAQDFKDYEIIVVNDGSTDDTEAVVGRFGIKVQCIRKLNGGQGSTRNAGIRAARGKYVAFLDADDLWAKDKLRLQIDLLEKTGLAWVYCDAFVFDGEIGKRMSTFGKRFRQYDGDILELLFLRDFIPSPTPVIRRSVFEDVGCFDEGLRFGEDWDMWLKIAAHYPVGLVAKPLAYYRLNATSVMGSADPQVKLQGILKMIEGAVARETVRLESLKSKALSHIYVDIGSSLAVRGQAASSRRMFLMAISLTPRSVIPYLCWGMAPVARWAKMMHKFLRGY